jgi:ribonuclease HII
MPIINGKQYIFDQCGGNMRELTIKEVEEKLFLHEEIKQSLLKRLRKDERKGVQALLQKWDKQKEKERILHQQFSTMLNFENKLRKDGYHLIAGVDEVGRGPLAGPVVAAAVILNEDFFALGINDSKKLTDAERQEFYKIIFKEAIAVGIGVVSPNEIDEVNIYEATKKAMRLAVSDLHIKPDFLLVDAMEIPLPIQQEKVIKGDEKSVSIAASSIVAKVTRDNMMKQIGKKFPGYGFEKHMGYGTKEHLLAIEKMGATIEHRRTFSPMKDEFTLFRDMEDVN